MNKIISKNGLILATFALMVTSIVAVTQYLTKEKIAQQEQKQLLKTLDQVIDRASYDNKLFMHCVPTQSLQFLGSKKTQRAFIAFKGDKPVAVALETTAPNGYNGNINLIVGINFNGIITGVRTLSHQETPGLGDKIELKKSDWIHSFTSHSIQDHKDATWQVKKDGGQFDQFTGATITPRAVVNAVKNSLIYFQLNKKMLTTQTQRCGDK
ncbi:MAG: electron transport complex subunit RsxG [Gammaproteobacteria bacterium]|nr:electron transport complex subunit RsxG [Gammaproteobacteria bacterium]